MKTWKIFIGLGLIFAAIFLILDAVGVVAPLLNVVGGISAFEIIVGILLIALIIERIARGRFSSIFFLLAFLFMLIEENIAYVCKLEDDNIINNWLLLLIALLLTIGFSILFSSKKRRRNHGISVEINGKSAESNFGASTIYVDCEIFSPAVIENNFGSCTVHFENVESYKGGETLKVENNFGSMLINVPENWIIKSNIENNLGGTHVARNDDKDGPILNIQGENNLGSLNIRFI